MNNQNDRDLYTIPPNFIGSSTFLGGMFKVRNVIEAGILAVAIGAPVMFLLPYSLMTRIIILCLTALPAAMIGLMGISGESLSSFIVIFFRYLKNRRTLGGETVKSRKRTKRQKVPGKEKRKKKQPKKKAVKNKRKPGKYERPAPEKPQKQESSKKQPKQEKPEPPAFLNPVAEYFPVEKIENGIIYTKDRRYVKIVEVIPINFLLRSTREQRNIIYSFVSYLKISPIRVQFKVLTRRADINLHIETVRREMEVETNEQCRLMQEDYLQFVQQISSREAVTRRFFLIFEHEPWSNSRKDEESDAITSLQTAVHTASNYLRQCGNKVIVPDNEDEFTVDVLYNLLCRNESAVTPLPSKVKEVAAQRFLANMDFEEIPAADFFSPKEIDFTHGRYIRIDGLYYAYLVVPSDGYRSQVPAGWLSLIVNAGDGVDMDMYLTRQSKERIVQTVGQQLRINRSKIKDASDTNTDFDDIDSAIKAGYYLKEGLANNEDFYYMPSPVSFLSAHIRSLKPCSPKVTGPAM